MFSTPVLETFPLTRDIGSGSRPNNYHVCTRFVCSVVDASQTDWETDAC
jgi:hypothetical protein